MQVRITTVDFSGVERRSPRRDRGIRRPQHLGCGQRETGDRAGGRSRLRLRWRPWRRLREEDAVPIILPHLKPYLEGIRQGTVAWHLVHALAGGPRSVAECVRYCATQDKQTTEASVMQVVYHG